MRRAVRRASIALAIAAVFAGFSTPASAADGLTITRADVVDGDGLIEYVLPANVATFIDPATATTLLENGTPVPEIAVTPVPSAGLEIVLVMDTSGSMNEGGAMEAAKQAATDFIESLPADVSVGVVSFADAPLLTAPLSTDRAATEAAIGSLVADGETSLYDAIVFSQQLFSGGTNDRQIVVLSDGGDTVSFNGPDAAIAVATGIRTSVVELTSSEANSQILTQLAAAGGGSMASVSDPQALGGLYAGIADDLLNRYRIRFAPGVTGDVAYTVQVATPQGVLEASTTMTVDPTATTLPTTTTVAGATTVPPATAPPTTVVVASESSPGFGLSSTALKVIGAAAVFVALLVLLLFLAAPRDKAASIDTFRRQKAGSTEHHSVVGRLADATEAAFEERRQYRTLAGDLDIAGIPLRTGEFLLVAAAGGLVFTLVLAVVLPPLLGIVVGLVASPFIARAVVRGRMEDRRRKFSDQIPDLLQTLVSSLRAGYGLPQALDVAASQVADPARTELQRVLFEVRIGRDPGEALEAMATRMNSADFNWVVAAMQINREIGGELASVLENVAETVRERQRLRRQIRVLTAEGRLSAYVLTALPILLAIFLWILNRDYFEPFKTMPGPALIVLGVVLMGVGWLWLRRIVKAQT